MRHAILFALALAALSAVHSPLAHADDTCPNGASLESATLLWLFGNPLPSGFGCFVVGSKGSCSSHAATTYICGDNNPSHAQYEVVAGISCTGSGSSLRVYSNLYSRPGTSGSFTLFPYPQNLLHCQCGVGCGWQ